MLSLAISLPLLKGPKAGKIFLSFLFSLKNEMGYQNSPLGKGYSDRAKLTLKSLFSRDWGKDGRNLSLSFLSQNHVCIKSRSYSVLS